MINIGAEDYNVLKQQYIKKYIRLELLDKEGKKSEQIKNNFMSAFYFGVATMYPYSIKEYWQILLLTHGGC